MFSILLLFTVFSTNTLGEKINLLEQNYYDLDQAEEIFNQFLDKYEKSYDEDEYYYRLNILKENLMKINEWNQEDNKGYSVHMFADFTEEEFSQGYLGLNDLNILRIEYETEEYIPKGNVPENLDWRDFGYVTSVKDQTRLAACGSCYVFSAVGHIEGQHAMKYNQTAIDLSTQQALDCDYLDIGCNGGNPVNVYETLSELGGSMTDKEYPYVCEQGTCKSHKDKVVVKVNAGRYLKFTDEEALKDAVAHLGPLSVPMRVTQKMAANVNKDIYKGADCGPTINHAVLIVGYGIENGTDFWIIKNSWSDKWADSGYMRLIRGIGACGIGEIAFFADVE